MPRKNSYICTECDQEQSQWTGQCPTCKKWNSLELIIKKASANSLKRNQNFENENYDILAPLQTKLGNCDKVFGSGITRSSISLLAGEPGIGKSTILLQIIDALQHTEVNTTVLYVSGEESSFQVKERAKRLGLENRRLKVLSTSIWQDVLEIVKQSRPHVVIIDSIQTIRDDDIASQAGSSAQLRAVTSEAIDRLKSRGITTILVGHVTKEGIIAGPKHVEHMVDTVLTFTKNESDLRILKAKKNRFGEVGEEAQFRMSSKGLIPVSFEETLPKISINEVGVTYSLIKKGTLNGLVEIQALVVENKFGQGKRIIQGLELNKVNTILAVLEKELKLPLNNHDIYIKTNLESATKNKNLDFAICGAILSSYYGVTFNERRAWLGELRLGGVIKEHSISLEEEKFLSKCSLDIVTSQTILGTQKFVNVGFLNDFIKDKAS